MRRSRTVLSRVRPWQLLKVVAYASRRGNCLRCTVQGQWLGWNSKLIRGRQKSWEVKLFTTDGSVLTSTVKWLSFVTMTLAFFTKPSSIDRFLIMEQRQPTFIRRAWGGMPGCDARVRKSSISVIGVISTLLSSFLMLSRL